MWPTCQLSLMRLTFCYVSQRMFNLPKYARSLVKLNHREIEDAAWSRDSRQIIQQQPGTTQLDLSFNRLSQPLFSPSWRHLTQVNLAGNRLRSVDSLLQHVPRLTTLDLSHNRLCALQLGRLGRLQWLNVAFNQLPSLILADHPRLQYLDCASNRLPHLDLSGCPNLTHLLGQENELTTLNLPPASPLRGLHLQHNRLVKFNPTGLHRLEYLGLDGNPLAQLVCQALPKLVVLSARNALLYSVRVVACPKLTHILLVRNFLIDAHFEQLPQLYQLLLNENELIHLDVSNLPKLEVLGIARNPWLTPPKVNELLSADQQSYCNECSSMAQHQQIADSVVSIWESRSGLSDTAYARALLAALLPHWQTLRQLYMVPRTSSNSPRALMFSGYQRDWLRRQTIMQVNMPAPIADIIASYDSSWSRLCAQTKNQLSTWGHDLSHDNQRVVMYAYELSLLQRPPKLPNSGDPEPPVSPHPSIDYDKLSF